MSVGKAFDHLNAVAALSNNISGALQNHIAARTAIRDYVICADEQRYGEVKLLIELALEFLEECDNMVERGGQLDLIQPFMADLREWLNLTQEVHDKFSEYQELVQTKVMVGFSNLAQSANTILHKNAALTTAVVLDVQIANVAVVSYLLKGDERLVEDAHHAIDSAKTKLEEVMKNAKSKSSHAALQSFHEMLNTYTAGFHEAVELRKKAYQVFTDQLAPLGNKIYIDLENYQEKLIDIQEGINDLKVLNDYRKKNKGPPLH